ncbi:putative necrosis-inducing factor-domain-containing protein [Panaeolus papilionaceus]|nr:putative necrosis-inducing factor-domain-containing protein [Panaeolus papilionaceus]
MKFSIIAVLLSSLFVVANSVPAPSADPGVSPAPVTYLASRDLINDCGNSWFGGETSGGSPRVDDCLTIANNISGGGTWTVALFGEHQLVQFGTCAFAVQATGGVGFDFRIGNQDIMDLIHSSIDMFQSNGLVGARGDMGCQGDPDVEIIVHWRIFHT